MKSCARGRLSHPSRLTGCGRQRRLRIFSVSRSLPCTAGDIWVSGPKPVASANGRGRPLAVTVGSGAGDAESPPEGAGPPGGLPLPRSAALLRQLAVTRRSTARTFSGWLTCRCARDLRFASHSLASLACADRYLTEQRRNGRHSPTPVCQADRRSYCAWSGLYSGGGPDRLHALDLGGGVLIGQLRPAGAILDAIASGRC
jgi:hypothetical protein